MATLSKKLGSTSVIVPIFIQDSSVSTGAGKTGLLYNTTSLIAYYKRNTATAAVQITLADVSTLGTWETGGFKEISSTNMPGEYELHLPDAVCSSASAATSVSVLLTGAAGMAPCRILIELVKVDSQDDVRFGLTSLPNAAAATSGGLPTVGGTIPTVAAGGSGGLLISGTNTGTTTFGALTVTGATTLTGAVSAPAGVTANISGTITTATSVTNAVVLPTGTGAGQINLSSGNVSLAATPPTAADVARAVWQDATAGDFTTPSSIGLKLATGVPAIAPGGVGGLLISGTNTGTTTFGALTVTGATTLTGAVSAPAGVTANISGTITTATSVTNAVVLPTGTGAGQINLSSGNVSLAATPPTAADIARAVWQDATAGDFTTPSSIGLRLTTGIPAIAPGAANGLFIAGTNAATTVTTAFTTTFTGNLTGNVGGNVVGSVGSVTNAVVLPANPPAAFLRNDSYGTAPSWYTAPATAQTIAMTVWQDAVPTDFTTASSIGQRLTTGIPNIAPGASDGLLKSGSNAGTTTLGALTVTGATTLTGAVSAPAGVTANISGTITTATNVTNAVTVTGTPAVNVTQWGGSAIATPLVAGYPLVDNGKWLGGTIPAVNVTGVPKVDLVDWLGSAPSALSSGLVQVTKTGYSLAAAGLDSIVIDSTINARQAIAYCSSALTGLVSGAGSGTVVFKAIDDGATTRITATVDAAGNRSAVTLNTAGL